jgi:hypothetical protein
MKKMIMGSPWMHSQDLTTFWVFINAVKMMMMKEVKNR